MFRAHHDRCADQGRRRPQFRPRAPIAPLACSPKSPLRTVGKQWTFLACARVLVRKARCGRLSAVLAGASARLSIASRRIREQSMPSQGKPMTLADVGTIFRGYASVKSQQTAGATLIAFGCAPRQPLRFQGLSHAQGRQGHGRSCHCNYSGGTKSGRAATTAWKLEGWEPQAWSVDPADKTAR